MYTEKVFLELIEPKKCVLSELKQFKTRGGLPVLP